MITSEKGLSLIKKWEGCTLKAYKLTGEKYYTIGYGHSFDTSITAGTVWTQAQADAALKKDLQKFEGYVAADVPLPLNQHQFDALVSYCYNRGRGGLRQLVAACKTLADYPAKMVELWGSATRYKTGLVNRRKAEAALFAGTQTAKGYISIYQEWINAILCDAWTPLVPDGIAGPKTKTAAVAALQVLLNRLYDVGLRVDGDLGPKTKAKLQTLRRGSSGVLVCLVQGQLYCAGYDPRGLDHSFGTGSDAAVRAFQLDHNLTVDGVVGPATWAELMA